MGTLSSISLDKYTPDKRNPWDRRKAAHLMERAGFGAALEDVDLLVDIGYKRAAQRLLYPEKIPYFYPTADHIPKELEYMRNYDYTGFTKEERMAKGNEFRNRTYQLFGDLQLWWLKRMIETPRPLEEKMVLFWHSHFATSYEKVSDIMLLEQQHLTMREHAFDFFPIMVIKMSRDPAMIRWLDSNSNVAGKPNENFARELMELFTMGEGNGYTEQDIVESARAFTGWQARGNKFYFNNGQHDNGQKTFLGKTGNWDGTDIIEMIMQSDAAAEFLPKKLWEYFVYPDPSPGLIKDLGQRFKDYSFNVRELVRMILDSEAFYSDEALGARIKSPVQFAVGTVRKLNTTVPDKSVLLNALRRMGQELFKPPDVNGWPEGPAWINTNTLIMRYQFANFLTTGEAPSGNSNMMMGAAEKDKSHKSIVDLSKYKIGLRAKNPSECIKVLSYDLLSRPLTPKQHAKLTNYLRLGANGARVSFDMNKVTSQERFYSAMNIILSSTEYQLC